VKPLSMPRWELARGKGLKHFLVVDGLLKCGSLFLVLGLLSMLLAFHDANRVIRESGSTPSLTLSDYLAILLSFTPRLVLFAVVGGALFALVMWYAMEYVYKRSHRDSGRA